MNGTFSLDVPKPPVRVRSWEGWGWTDPEKPNPESIILGKDVRRGDVMKFIIRDGERAEPFADSKVIRENGVLGFWNKYRGKFEKYQFIDNQTYEVALPRPEPEANEFGPVSP